MQSFFNSLAVVDVHDDAFRNILSIRVAQNLYDDLLDDEYGQQVLVQAEIEAKPKKYRDIPIVNRPFDEAEFYAAITYPFENLDTTRYSNGDFGVWYGGADLDTTIHETVFHWRRFTEAAEGASQINPVIMCDRRVFLVRCDAALFDFRSKIADYPDLIGEDYSFTQGLGWRIHREGHPGLLTRSARCDGRVYAIFTPNVLSNPRNHCDLTYRWDVGAGRVTVERQPGTIYMQI